MISHIIVKSKAKLFSLQNPGQPMGWPVATALYYTLTKVISRVMNLYTDMCDT